MNVKKLIRLILTNGYWALFPILLWNLILASQLPVEYLPEYFNADIPVVILAGENLLRMVIFMLPLLTFFSLKETVNHKGFLMYIGGSLIYYLSWIILIYQYRNNIDYSVITFTAPAYTTLVWLIGIGLWVKPYSAKFQFKKVYIYSSILFVLFHTAHSLIVFYR